jgi:hypothetical protein
VQVFVFGCETVDFDDLLSDNILQNDQLVLHFMSHLPMFALTNDASLIFSEDP